MKLNQFHREALLWALDKATERLESARRHLLTLSDTDSHMKHQREIDAFLAGEELHRIKESLISNDIDY